MGKRRKRQRGDDSSSSYPSSIAGMSTEETPPVRSSDIHALIEAIRKDRRKEAEGFKQTLKETKEELKEEINKMNKQLKKLNRIVLRTQSEQLNGSSGNGSPAPRSEPNHMQPPRFSLKIKSKMKDAVEKGNSIITDDGDSIDLYDGDNLIAPSHPLASAKVMMVVLDGNFNNSRCSWPKVEFENIIKRPRQRNFAIGDVDQGIESIVSKCIFRLNRGTGRPSGATITENSGNRKVKLGVMVLPDDSYEEYKNERVLEGVSEERFLVREQLDPPRASKKQKQAPVGCGQERSGPMPNSQYSSQPTLNTQTAGNISGQPQLQAYTNMPSSSTTPRDNTLGAVPQHSVEPSTDQQPSSFSEGHRHISAGVQTPMISDSMNQAMHSLDGGVQPWISDLAYQPMHGPYGYFEHLYPVQLLWDRPRVEPSKSWNLLDQLMPLYSSQTKIHSGDFSAMRLMPEHYDSLTTYSRGPYQRLFFSEEALFLKKMMRDLPITTIPKEVMQTHRNRGVLIQPLEPDDSDDEPPLKRKLRNKYQLRFVNKVCKAYYTGEKIKADDGNLLNVALYDENNANITSGPLSSASVEVVVLHGDFNATGQDYWTSEEFSSSVVCPQSTKEPPAVGGDRVLVLVDGQASLGDAFFQKSSIYARTGKFKMGVMLTSTPDERVQEGISEPFWVWNRKGWRTRFTVCQRWHRAINAIIFIWRLQSKTYRTRSMRRPLLSRDIGDACLELLKGQQCMQDSLLDAWTSGVEGFEVQHPKAAVMKNVTLLDPRNKGKGTPYHKMLIKQDIRDVQNEEYLPFVDVKENDNEDAAEEAHDGNSGKEKMMEPDENHGNQDAERSETAENEKEQQQDKQYKKKGEKEEAKKTKAIAQRSIVWESFTKIKIGDTVTKIKCKHCGFEFRVGPHYGTSHLCRHLKGWERNPNRNTDPNQGTPNHKMLKKGGILDVKNEEYLPFADIKENENEDAAEEAHDGNSGKEKGLENTHGASSISMQALQFVPNIRSGSFADTGDRSCMEDEHIRIDDLCARLGSQLVCPLPSALYGVFDGHGGPDAAAYMKKHAMKFLFEDCDFPKASQVDEAFLQSVEKSVRRAFSQADFSMLNDISHTSGTTALIALVFGRQLLVANAGHSRAVLYRNGVAIGMTQDHGVLSLRRPLGIWGMKESCSSFVIPEPEFRQVELTGDDEFLILASGGLWDVMTSTSAVLVARRELSKHGDPERCARELVSEGLRLGATKNLTVIVVCFFKEPGSLQTRQPKRRITSPINPHGSKCPRIKKDKLHL